MKLNFRIISGTVVTLLGISAAVADAHHSMVSTYSRTKTSSVDGIVTKFNFRNPHVLLYIDVTGADGKTINWMGEGSSATGWRREGWTGKEFKPGDRVRLTGDATLDGSPMVWLDKMERLDAESGASIATLSPRSNPSTDATAATDVNAFKTIFIPKTLSSGIVNFSGVTQSFSPPEDSSNGPFFGNDRELPYNAVGRAAFEAFDLANDPQVFCDPPGFVRQAGYTPYGFELNQEPDTIIFKYEEYDGYKSIPIVDASDIKLPAAGPKSHLGDSVAYYQDGALVIETVNLLENPSGHRGRPLSEDAHVKQVITRKEQSGYGTILTVSTTVTDPKFLTEPWTIERIKVYTKDYDYVENECVPPLRQRTDMLASKPDVKKTKSWFERWFKR